jgi:hypothetical protein
MKKTIIGGLMAVMLILPLSVDAHESQVFEVNGVQYKFVIGSLNEPVVVDDKTGVDLRISENLSGNPVEGLGETLKVELIAGDKKKTLDLSPVYNTPGSYKAPFFPTVATTLSYRVFGTLNETPIDLTFSCSPAGHTAATENTERIEVSDKVFRVSKTGSYGCPQPKADFGFPEVSASVVDMKKESEKGMLGVGLGILGVLLAGFALMRKK